MSSLTLMSFQNYMSFFLMLNSEDCLKKAGNKTFDGRHWLPQYLFPTMKSVETSNCLVIQNSLKHCVQQKKETYTGLEQHESE